MSKTEERVTFTKQMRRDYTLLLPEMLPIHFEMIKNVFIECGYKAEVLSNKGPHIAQLGLKYVHNDTCYPALLVIGQMIDALKSGRYDLNKTALMITQTGGGCRASNYIHLLRKALKKAGFANIPVVSLNLSGMEKNSGFKITLPMLRKMIAAAVYGDQLMLLSNQVRPYELKPGETDDLLSLWLERINLLFKKGEGYGTRQMSLTMTAIAKAFEKIPVSGKTKKRAGIVGEIYVKYAGLGNNCLEDFLRSQDCEYMVPGLMGFLLFKVDNRLEDIKLYGGSKIKYFVVNILMRYLTRMEELMRKAVNSTRFLAPSAYSHTKTLVKDIIGYGSKMGEGWLLTAEMLELVELGYPNIVCTQPFGCLPNHINGRGMMNRIKEISPLANIVAIDYDPSASRVNQENRIKLMLSSAQPARQGKIENRPSLTHTREYALNS